MQILCVLFLHCSVVKLLLDSYLKLPWWVLSTYIIQYSWRSEHNEAEQNGKWKCEVIFRPGMVTEIVKAINARWKEKMEKWKTGRLIDWLINWLIDRWWLACRMCMRKKWEEVRQKKGGEEDRRQIGRTILVVIHFSIALSLNTYYINYYSFRSQIISYTGLSLTEGINA